MRVPDIYIYVNHAARQFEPGKEKEYVPCDCDICEAVRVKSGQAKDQAGSGDSEAPQK